MPDAPAANPPSPLVPSLLPPGDPHLVGWGEQGQKPIQGPHCVTGPACGIMHGERTWVVQMESLRLGGEGQPLEWTENQKGKRSSVACPRQVLGWVWEGWDPGGRMGDL